MIFLLLLFSVCLTTAEYEIGVGIADVTGPIVGVTLLGYGSLDQQGTGVHLRQWSRAFIIQQGPQRIAFVSVDCAMMSDGVRIEVIETLRLKYGDLYNMDNVMISATHTHSSVGGYMKHLLFDLPSFGFSPQAFNAMVSGIVKSISMAHKKMQRGKLILQRGRVDGANINRSPTSYIANPPEERQKYTDNVDKDLTQLQFWSSSGQPLGVINWFAVHPTTMNNTNTLVSSDNMGYASIKFEEKMNDGHLLGKGPFVAAFASSNLGDVSPNVRGPRCEPSGTQCSSESTCSSYFDSCYAQGPGSDMFDSTKIIAERIFDVAWDLWNRPKKVFIEGAVKSIHQYVDMPAAKMEVVDPETNKTYTVSGCRPAMGYSFSSGTTDGAFAGYIVPQGTKESMFILNTVRDILGKPNKEDEECHAAKPILLYTGGMRYPYDWQPWVVSSHVALVGQLAILCVPGEFTTMAGRRMREAVAEAAGEGTVPILAGLCNTYSDYITTFEEYQVQRYEGASTLYGPHTHRIHMAQFRKLTEALISNKTLERGPEPMGIRDDRGSLMYPYAPDIPSWGKMFGDVLKEPPQEVKPGDVVTASFVAGHPGNNLMLDDTYITVEIETSPGIWKVVATDSNWETRFHWRRNTLIFGTATLEYFVPEAALPGTYRFRHFGHYRNFHMEVISYVGTTRTYRIEPLHHCAADPWSWWKVASWT